MVSRRSQLALAPIFLVAAVALVGCAKRPAVIMAGSPSGMGAAAAVQRSTVVTESTTVVTQSGEQRIITTQQEVVSSQSAVGAGQSSVTAPAAPGTAGAQSESTDRQIAAAPATQESPSASPSSRVAQTTPRPEQRDFEAMAQLELIHFDFDKSDIRPDTARILDANANWFRSNPNYLILIEGHCDERGTNDYNLALGERRARSTFNYLIAQGVASNRMTVISYGEERPLCTEHNESCWWKNRRAAFLVKESVPSALPAAATGVTPAGSGAMGAPQGSTDPGAKVTDPVSSPSQPGSPTPPGTQRRQAP